MIRALSFKGQQVAVFGLGLSGRAVVRSLFAGGAQVFAWDDSEAGRHAAADAGIELSDLSVADWSEFDALILAPGVPLTHPEPHWTVNRARASDVPIIGDIEIFARERQQVCPDSPWIAITGTNGKSTTTALIHHILRHAGYSAELGGNIGKAILTLAPPADDMFHVIEMSSFQIDLTPTLNPIVGVMLNITPDHLDRHGTIENYAATKERLPAGAQIACIGIDDDFSRAIYRRRAAQKGGAIPFGINDIDITPGYGLSETSIFARGEHGTQVELANLAGISTLRGLHNAQNAVAAVAVVHQILSHTGRSTGLAWQQALETFPGLPHRLEEVGRLGDILFVNDSKATNAEATEKALQSFQGNIYWVAGGRAKAGGLESLSPLFARITKGYLFGEASADFAKSLSGHVPNVECKTLEQALRSAIADAQSEATPSVILLSPACASYDQYKNFEQRGDHFRKLVSELPNVQMRQHQ